MLHWHRVCFKGNVTGTTRNGLRRPCDCYRREAWHHGYVFPLTYENKAADNTEDEEEECLCQASRSEYVVEKDKRSLQHQSHAGLVACRLGNTRRTQGRWCSC